MLTTHGRSNLKVTLYIKNTIKNNRSINQFLQLHSSMKKQILTRMGACYRYCCFYCDNWKLQIATLKNLVADFFVGHWLRNFECCWFYCRSLSILFLFLWKENNVSMVIHPFIHTPIHSFALSI